MKQIIKKHSPWLLDQIEWLLNITFRVEKLIAKSCETLAIDRSDVLLFIRGFRDFKYGYLVFTKTKLFFIHGSSKKVETYDLTENQRIFIQRGILFEYISINKDQEPSFSKFISQDFDKRLSNTVTEDIEISYWYEDKGSLQFALFSVPPLASWGLYKSSAISKKQKITLAVLAYFIWGTVIKLNWESLTEFVPKVLAIFALILIVTFVFLPLWRLFGKFVDFMHDLIYKITDFKVHKAFIYIVLLISAPLAAIINVSSSYTSYDGNSSSSSSSSSTRTLSGGDAVPEDVHRSLRLYIIGSGYSCEEIDHANVLNLKQGYSVWCNSGGRLAYHYEVVDRGGNWIVTLK